MKKENHPIYWFVINLSLLIGSMFMTWFIIFFIDPPGIPVSGGNYIVSQLVSAVLDYEFDWYWFSSLLEGIGGVFVFGYIVLIIIKIATRKVFAGSKTRFIILLVTASVFLLCDVVFLSYLPRPGYWLFIAGIFSSAILEWQYSRAHINLLTGKRTRKK